MNRHIIKQGFFLALGEVAYITLVVSFMNHNEKNIAVKSEMLAGMAMLTLFVVSASISGALVLGKPILLYLDGKRREAILLFGTIIAWLVLFLLGVLWYIFGV